MKNMKKALSLLLVMVMACAVAVPAFAAEAEVVDSIGSVAGDVRNEPVVGFDDSQDKFSEYYDEFNRGDMGDKTVEVFASHGPTYSVVIPKTVILDGQSGIGAYSVKVRGDIEGMKQITVRPAASLQLTQAGKPAITATIAQGKTAWTYNQMNENDYHHELATATGTITAEGMSAGMWSGSFLMTISYDDLGA